MVALSQTSGVHSWTLRRQIHVVNVLIRGGSEKKIYICSCTECSTAYVFMLSLAAASGSSPNYSLIPTQVFARCIVRISLGDRFPAILTNRLPSCSRVKAGNYAATFCHSPEKRTPQTHLREKLENRKTCNATLAQVLTFTANCPENMPHRRLKD